MITAIQPARSLESDPVSQFESHRRQLIRDKLAANITLFVRSSPFLFLGWSIYYLAFLPPRPPGDGIAANSLSISAPSCPPFNGRFSSKGRNEQGSFPQGSIGFWYSDFWKYLALIWEPILMAVTATVLGTALAVILSFHGCEKLYAIPFWLRCCFTSISGVLPRSSGNTLCSDLPSLLSGLGRLRVCSPSRSTLQVPWGNCFPKWSKMHR